ncbi:porin [uncultured Hyphomicrobium sp.]|uniref:porin n=1 Tax=uncultured Hyphomicrobium sp. TaxID=194373 RepID=UPI0025E52137|nr:porin [uncultured Hyphomicrobium sp.]
MVGVGVWMGRRQWVAVAAGLLALAGAVPSSAADLGGNCCADLEERIAELEATTARKGNRKVSLEVYGQVNESIIYWDDGVEDNAYVVTNDNSRTRFGFRGKAKINSDFEAGYRIEIGIRTANSKRFTQDNDEGDGNPTDVGFDLRDSYWYLKSKTYGGVSVGQQADATDAITETNLTQTKDFSKYSDVEDTGLGLFLRSTDGGLSARSYRNLLGDSGDQPGDGDRRQNTVKYESPTFAGFTASASWGEDDVWDIALRYAGEFAGFKLAAGIGYGKITDGPETKIECPSRGGGAPHDEDCQQVGGSISIIHEATGIFVNFGAGQKKDDVLSGAEIFVGTNPDDKDAFWAVQAGIEKKFNSLGKTTIYGEYFDYEGSSQNRTLADDDAVNPFAPGSRAAIWDTGLTVYGAGIAQGIDAAAMVLYLSYRHVEADLTVREVVGGVATGPIADAPIEDLDLVQAGAVIKF